MAPVPSGRLQQSGRDGFAEVNGNRIHFVEWGSSNCPPLLLLHGFAMHAHVWGSFAPAMSSNWWIVAMDFRGHGDSDWAPDHQYDRLTLASDVAEFSATQFDSPPVIVGHSMGGAVALLVATRWGGLVTPRGIVMVDSSLTLPSKKSELGRFLDQAPTTFPSFDAMVDYAGRLSKARARVDLARSVERNAVQRPDGTWAWKYDPALLTSRRSTSSDTYSMLWTALEAITCPVLYVRASHRSHLHDDYVDRLRNVNQLVDVVTIPDTSHAVMRDNPTGFKNAVEAFLESLP